jgi:hypothetical protein
MATFTGSLNSNEIFSALFNMIISQQVFADNIKGTTSSLVDRARVDGGLYGDTKLYYSADVLETAPWGNDAEASNLLALHRPDAPECQKITLDVFRQISLTVDDYLSKRAWGSEGAFSQFNSVMLGMIGDTRKIYDSTTYNAFIGTEKATGAGQNITVTLPTNDNAEAQARLQAQTIAETLANLFTDLSDVSRQFNDYGFMRSYDKGDFIVVWNSKQMNKIKNIDLPTIFDNAGLKATLTGEVLPARYFGSVNTTSGTTGTTNTTIRALVEKDYGSVHCFPGELLPASTAYLANETYTEDAKIICKVIHKGSVPYMSSFEVGTSFYNPVSLTENHYLTFGRNTLEYLKNYPFITIAQA